MSRGNERRVIVQKKPTVFGRRQMIEKGVTLILSAFLPSWVRASNALGDQKTAQTMPYPAQEIYPVVHAGKLYVIGGISQFGPLPLPTGKVAIYDPVRGWSEGPSLPHRIHHAYGVSFKGRLLILGGYKADFGGIWQSHPQCYELKGNDWHAVMTLPAAMAEFAAASVGDHLIVAGGRRPIERQSQSYLDLTNTDDTFLFDGERWLEGHPIPTARNSVGTAVRHGCMHVIGGRQMRAGEKAQPGSTAHEVFDPIADRWHSLAPLPKAQAGTAAVTLGDDIFLFGGERQTEPERLWPQVWQYQGQSDTWLPREDLLPARHGHGAVVLNDEIHIVGGGLKVGAGGTTDLHEIYTP